MKKINIACIIAFMVIGCRNNSSNENIDQSAISNSSVETISENINGTYYLENNSVSLEITVSGNTWVGKTLIKTGFGDAYDSENAEYQNGIMKENNLYDDSGYVKIGYVHGSSLTTTVSGQSVTLSK
jgi:hypothetical protein